MDAISFRSSVWLLHAHCVMMDRKLTTIPYHSFDACVCEDCVESGERWMQTLYGKIYRSADEATLHLLGGTEPYQ